MSTKIEGSTIRKRLRDLGLPGGNEVLCCGGKKRFSRDYQTQLRRLKYPKGDYAITENGITVALISL